MRSLDKRLDNGASLMLSLVQQDDQQLAGTRLATEYGLKRPVSQPGAPS